jgi:hypothetical protein
MLSARSACARHARFLRRGQQPRQHKTGGMSAMHISKPVVETSHKEEILSAAKNDMCIDNVGDQPIIEGQEKSETGRGQAP